MATTRGSIRDLDQYSQSKLLCHDSWQQEPHKLPRNITPSDLDTVFDDSRFGRRLMAEFKHRNGGITHWGQMPRGQRRVYAAFVAAGCGRTLAALCIHGTDAPQVLDTKRDVLSFQIMHFAALLGHATSPVFDGSLWPRFVAEFYEGRQFKFTNEPPRK